MKNIAAWLELLKNPKQFFFSLENPRLKYPFLIIILMSIMTVVFTFLYTLYPTPILSKLKERSEILHAIYPFFMVLLYFVIGLGMILLKSVWVKLGLRILSIKTKLRLVFSCMAYAQLPNLIRYMIGLAIPAIAMTNYAGDHKIPYMKTSLAQLFISYSSTHPLLFYWMRNVELFEIWILVLEIIAVSAIGRISYRKSSLIVILFWVISSIPYMIMKHGIL